MDADEGFEWDEKKNRLNKEKHGVDFEEAKEIFYGAHVVSRSPFRQETRWIAVGDAAGRTIAVIFTWRGSRRRIISARRARKDEERTYRGQTMGRSAKGQD